MCFRTSNRLCLAEAFVRIYSCCLFASRKYWHLIRYLILWFPYWEHTPLSRVAGSFRHVSLGWTPDEISFVVASSFGTVILAGIQNWFECAGGSRWCRGFLLSWSFYRLVVVGLFATVLSKLPTPLRTFWRLQSVTAVCRRTPHT